MQVAYPISSNITLSTFYLLLPSLVLLYLTIWHLIPSIKKNMWRLSPQGKKGKLSQWWSILFWTHGQFNNSLESQLPTKKPLAKLSSINDLDLFCLNTDSDCYLGNQPACCQNFSPHSFSKFKNTMHNDQDCLSLLHNRVRSLKINLENL